MQLCILTIKVQNLSLMKYYAGEWEELGGATDSSLACITALLFYMPALLACITTAPLYMPALLRRRVGRVGEPEREKVLRVHAPVQVCLV